MTSHNNFSQGDPKRDPNRDPNRDPQRDSKRDSPSPTGDLPKRFAGSSVDGRKLTREDLQDLAKIGGDILKRTVGVGIDVFKEVTDGLPKEASQYLHARKDEVLKGLSKDMLQGLVSMAIDRTFQVVREHRLDISIRIKRNDESAAADGKSQPNGKSGRPAVAADRGSGIGHRHGSKRGADDL